MDREPSQVSRGRLLVADGEPASLDAYVQCLSQAGFDVAQASDGEEAWRQLQGGGFEAVLSGLALPKADGLTVLRRVRSRFRDMPFVLLLDRPDNRAAMAAIRAGAAQALVKPVAPEILAEAAAYAVRLRRGARRPVEARESRTGPADAASISATDAKNEFGRILEQVIRGGRVVITKHDSPKAVLISIDEFQAFSNAHRLEIDALSREFDDLLERMQAPGARAGMKAAFDAKPKELGQSARAAARKRA